MPDAKIYELELEKASGYHDIYNDRSFILLPDFDLVLKELKVKYQVLLILSVKSFFFFKNLELFIAFENVL